VNEKTITESESLDTPRSEAVERLASLSTRGRRMKSEDMEESKRSSPRRTQLKRVRRRLVKNSWNMLAEKNFKALDIMKRMKTLKLMERKK